MAQTGYSKVQIYSSSTATHTPSAGNLTNDTNGSELAINITDGKLFYKDNSGTVQVLATKGSGVVGGSNTQVQYNSSGTFSGSANLTFDGTTLTSSGFSGPLNGTVGATTANTGAFTTLSASSTVSGTGFSTYLASPPAIGGTAAAAVTGTIVKATTNFTFQDNTTQNTAATGFGFKNRIIDGGFIINQRVYTSGTSLSAGSYGHDRWKAGSGGGTYTFTQGSLGVNTTVTITAGTLVQVIEGCNLAEGGTYVLSWTGTAQGRLNGGTYGSSGTVTVTGWTSGANLSVEFNTGTLGSVQLEKGSTATSFDYRSYNTELALCQRYFFSSGGTHEYLAFLDGNNADYPSLQPLTWPVTMRSTPSVNTFTFGTFGYNSGSAGASFTPSGGTVAYYGNGQCGYIAINSISNYPGAAQTSKVGYWSGISFGLTSEL